MQPIDLLVFIASGEPKHLSVARIGADLCKLVGCSSDLVKIDHRYALKSTHKHRLQPEHFQILPTIISAGRVISDRPRHLTFFHFDPIYGQWFQASVKRNEAATELWVA